MNYRTFTDAFFKAWNTHSKEAILSLYDEHYTGEEVSEGMNVNSRQQLSQMIDRFLGAFPDLRMKKLDTIADYQKVAIVFQLSGVHQGRLMNIPATGKSVNVKGVLIFEFKNGKISKGTNLWDVAAMLRQIGLLPELPKVQEEAEVAA